MVSAVNPHILRDLHELQEHSTPATITLRSEGRTLRSFCEICDVDAVTVTLFPFDSGLLVRFWLGQVQGVEAAL